MRIVSSDKNNEDNILTETNQIKTAYNRMYSVLRKYVWDFDIVSALVDVEVEAYKLFPDLNDLAYKLSKLRSLICQAVDTDDTVIIDAIDKFAETVKEINEVYVQVKYAKEVLV